MIPCRHVYILTSRQSKPKSQTMKNLLSNKTLQATYGGDVVGGSVVRGMLGAFLYTRFGHRPLIRTSQSKVLDMLKTASNTRLQALQGSLGND